MKRSVLLLAALFAVLSVQADNRPQAVLKQLTAALGALEGYSVVFEVHTDGDVVPFTSNKGIFVGSTVGSGIVSSKLSVQSIVSLSISAITSSVIFCMRASV